MSPKITVIVTVTWLFWHWVSFFWNSENTLVFISLEGNLVAFFCHARTKPINIEIIRYWIEPKKLTPCSTLLYTHEWDIHEYSLAWIGWKEIKNVNSISLNTKVAGTNSEIVESLAWVWRISGKVMTNWVCMGCFIRHRTKNTKWAYPISKSQLLHPILDFSFQFWPDRFYSVAKLETKNINECVKRMSISL